MIRAAILLCAALAAPAWAIEPPETIGLHVATAHARSGYNDVNPGVYFRWHDGPTLGAYRNSEWRNSAYVGWTVGDQFALTVGAVTGYERRPVLPMLVPSVRIPLVDGVSARLSFLAPYAKGTAALHLSIEWRLQ